MALLEPESRRPLIPTRVVLWLLLWPALLVPLVSPVPSLKLRLLLLFIVTAILLGAFLLMRRRIIARNSLVALVLVSTLALLAPGREYDRAALRKEYVRALSGYQGTRYLWGGESKRGIDCSGLVRSALMDANFKQGVATANPRLLREGLFIWWNDCSARDLGIGYQGKTRVIAESESINGLDMSILHPGDMAVTAGGVHVLAYLGDGAWTEANPERMQVVVERVPQAENHWFSIPVKVIRWCELESCPPTHIQGAERRRAAR